ncbi:unnamed protein product [Spirodela intermedia]|uniref:Uncharacterized protein n=2 Tax=Spirodela intermedia TaxID=51605 RepID=A0A7I8K7S0_SPIIN|nr:unnamed protein product [Spirodela intermedia]CAA6657500.1 unnamed protein product [Spirodela intermedia]CAA7393565.1 unnamed protein product [Spirodela intermedia]
MFTPGAIRSGFRIPGVMALGPREENAATTGDGCTPTLVPANTIVAVGAGSDKAYDLMAFPIFSPTAAAGRMWASATSSSPFMAVFDKTIPRPPAAFTTKPFCTLGLTPRSHSTIFPATFSGIRVPERQRFPLVALVAFPA